MAAKGGHIDFMFLGPPPTRPLDPMLEMLLLLLVITRSILKTSEVTEHRLPYIAEMITKHFSIMLLICILCTDPQY